ncbi:MAG: phosphomannomutase/phosphoglucomutase [bacterium]|nr:phosphomannomutase/phosphoglucomutase [bacterium]
MAKINKLMFREYDIRGRVDEEDLNPTTVELIAKGYGTFLRKREVKEVVLGHDSRLCSEDFHAAMIRGLTSTGCDVIDLGMTLAPIMYWSQYYFDTKGGVMITGSHNPKDWSGFKLAFGPSYTLIGEELQEIYQTIEAATFIEGQGEVRKEEIIESYTNDLISRIKIRKPLKVVIDAGNGTSGAIVPNILRKAGLEVFEQFCELDPNFPNHEPDPALVETVQALGSKIKEVGADIGVAYDGDGDRLGIVDEHGENIWPDRYMILLARQLLEKKPGSKIIFDVKCSQALEEDIKAHGGIPIMWKTGHSHIKHKLHTEKAAFAGEMSGHIFYVDDFYGFDDAVFTTLRFLEYLSLRDNTLSELIATTPYYLSTPAIHVDCPDDKKYRVVDELTEEFKRKYEVIDVNGARVLFGDAWGLVRASSNLPVLVLRFEAKTQQRLDEIQKIFKEKLDKFDSVSKEWENE